MVQRKRFSYEQFKIALHNEIDFLTTEMSKDWKSEIEMMQSRICKISDFDRLSQANSEMSSLFEMIENTNKFRNNFCDFFIDFAKEVGVNTLESSIPVDECDEYAFDVITTAMGMLNEFDVIKTFPQEVADFSWLWNDGSTFFQSVIYHSFVEEKSRCRGFQVHQTFKVKQSQLS